MNLDLLYAELKSDEGVYRNKYLDTVGVPTCGIGHNLKVSPLPAGWTFPLSDDQIKQLFTHDIAIVFAGLDLHLPWWRNLTEVRQRVLANMTFNLGIGGLLEFKNTLENIKTGNYDAAATGMLASEWAKQVKGRAVRLANAIKNDFIQEPK